MIRKIRMDFAIIQKDTPFFVKIRMYTKAKTRKPGSTFPIPKMMLMMSVTDTDTDTDRRTSSILEVSYTKGPSGKTIPKHCVLNKQNVCLS